MATATPITNNYSGNFTGSRFESGNVYNAENQYFYRPAARLPDPTWEEIFGWLTQDQSDLNFIPLQEELSSRREPYTGDWFLESSEFQSWVRGDHDTLMCIGARGIGKTMLTALAEKHLREMITGDMVSSFVLFCYLSREYQHTCEAYLAALLGQILQERRQASPGIKDLYIHHKPLNSRPNIEDLLKVLLAETTGQGKVFLILDALDEASQQTRSDLVKSLVKLKAERRDVHLLLTSYNKQTLEFQIPDVLYFELIPASEDLENFIKSQIQQKVYITQLSGGNLEIEKRLADTLVAKAKGLFFLADQHLKQIEAADPQTVAQLMQLANNLSTTIEKVYGDSLTRIMNQKGFPKRNAQIILLWLAGTGQELSVELIRHAVAFAETEEVILDEDNLLTDRMILIPCQGLVQIRESRRSVSFSHPSGYEYFGEKIETLGVPAPQFHILLTCLRQLRYLDAFLAQCDRPDSVIVNDYFKKYPLLDYTLRRIGYHSCQYPGSQFMDELDRLVCDTNTLQRIATIFLWKMLPENFRPNLQWRKASKIHLLTILQLLNALSQTVRDGENINLGDDEGWTALRWSVLLHDGTTTRHLLELCADINRRDHYGLTTLQWVLGDLSPTIYTWDNMEFSDYHGAVIGNSFSLTPFSAQASELGALTAPIYTDLGTLELLVELSEPTYLLQDGNMLMRLACQKRLGNVVTRFISKGIQPQFLIEALRGSCTYLEGKNMELKDYSEAIIGCVIRINEADWRHSETPSERLTLDDKWMCQLVTKDTMYELGPRQRSALSFATEMGFVNVCKKLIDEGADVNQCDADGWTPLMWAAVRPKSTKVLIENCRANDYATAVFGAAIEIAGTFSTRADLYQDLSWTSQARRKSEIVELLLISGAKWWLKDNAGISALQKAQWDNIPGIASFLENWQYKNGHLRVPSPDVSPDDSEDGESFIVQRTTNEPDVLYTNSPYGALRRLLSSNHAIWGRGVPAISRGPHMRSPFYRNGISAWTDSRLGQKHWATVVNAYAHDYSRWLLLGEARFVATNDFASVYIGSYEQLLPYLPPQVMRTILSVIQLQVTNLSLKDYSALIHGMFIKRVGESTPWSGPISFLREERTGDGLRGIMQQFTPLQEHDEPDIED